MDTAAFDRFSAVRDFVSKEHVSLKQVHNIIDEQNRQWVNLHYANDPMTRFRQNRIQQSAQVGTSYGKVMHQLLASSA